MKKKLSLNQKYWLSIIGANLLSVGVPLVTAFLAFPPKNTVSVGMTLIITAIISLGVLRKQIKAAFQTASVLITWLVMLVVCIIAKFFVDRMLLISIVGAISNAASVPVFKIADEAEELRKLLKDERNKRKVTEILDNERKT